LQNRKLTRLSSKKMSKRPWTSSGTRDSEMSKPEDLLTENAKEALRGQVTMGRGCRVERCHAFPDIREVGVTRIHATGYSSLQA
jgi:hypothetical protein